MGNLTSSQGQQTVAQGPDYSFGSSDWGTIPNYLASIPSTFAPSATSRGNVITSSGGANATGGNVAGAGGASAGSPSNAAAGANPVAASGVTSGSLADYFLRGVVIILGFIFVAIGLNMFRPGTIAVPGLHK